MEERDSTASADTEHTAGRRQVEADEGGQPTSADSSILSSRRTYLKGVALAGLSGVASTTVSAHHELRDNYRTVVDVVDEGADPEGGESITPILRDLCDDDTLVEFPEGRYYVDEQLRFTNFDNFGMVGAPWATLVPADYHNFEGPTYRMFRLGTGSSPGRDLHVENFTVDQTASDTGIRVINGVVSDGMTVRDIDVRGRHDSGLPGPGLFNVTDPSGEGLVERFDAPDGADFRRHTPSPSNTWWIEPTGFYANQNRGTLRFKDCTLGGFPGTGLYASQADGKVVVEGGLYENSDTASIRLGGEGSYVTGATVRVDTVTDDNETQRGIRLENTDDVGVFDTDVEITEPNGDAILVRHNCGNAWIQDVRITVEGDRPNSGILVSSGAGRTTLYRTEIDFDLPGGYALRFPRGNETDHETVNCEDVTIRSNTGDEAARCSIINGRDNAEFRSVVVRESSDVPYRRALRNSGDDCLVHQGEYRCSYVPITDFGSGTWVEEVHAESHGGAEAVRLGASSDDVLIKESTLVNGIDDRGSDGLRTWANDFTL